MEVISNSQRYAGTSKHWHRLLVGLLVIVVICVAATWFMLNRPQSDRSDTNGVIEDTSQLQPKAVCDNPLLLQANEAINKNDILAMTGVSEAIVKLVDYDYDPNCLYALVRYDLMIGQTDSARVHLARLKRVYNNAVGYSQAYTPATMPFSDIERSITSLEQNNKSLKHSVDGETLRAIDALGGQQQ